MSSPIKRRTALVGKSTNIRSSTVRKGSVSPSKRSQVNVDYALRHSPVRNVPTSSLDKNPAPAPAPLLPFVMHEETPEERTATLMNHMSLSHSIMKYHDENDFSGVKENMSPSKLHRTTKNSSPTRSQLPTTAVHKPLRDLSISEHEGSVEDPRTSESIPLTLHYTKKTRLPNFITPPRDKHLRQYFSTTRHDDDDHSHLFTSKSTDDIPKDKVVRKLDFKICEN
ncbi:hypothetical protein ZYGR_0R00160 [Zygosaccharomyces rouxii]|uniref:ZYRO0F00330p n=2 Tax=Zygosaccharomyces rouxii TaxID=4956 RepID=C5DWX2_ZYGRC|nr:uncharacterized protein ZYRO0F00330g [Zygosaccharomyces rouxii]KAH9199049.1 hypothetical protein LQ764DRAFT_115588 [Zygosaccharomyces rouxii]GAV49775.1 hypothetical protein ZYGR_0R00160 [Zygosaccharomyces rouxii]CAR28283.1 ZYRO0F00330p [Zygosaccharomyces rouxii]